MHRNRLRTVLSSSFLLWMFINLNTIVKGSDSSSMDPSMNPSVEFRPQETCDIKKLPKKHLICYYRIEEQPRQIDLNPCLCTHLIYSHVVVKENFSFVAGRKGDLKHIVSLKERNPWLKVLVSLKPSLSNGQWFNQSISYHNKDEYSLNNQTLISVHNIKNKFARRTRDFLIRHGLDGIDINWPQFYSIEEDENSSTASIYNERKSNLLQLVKSFNEIFRQTTYDDNTFNDPTYSNGLLISLTTGNKVHDLMSNYDFNSVQHYLNFVNLLAFDFPLLENDQETDMNHVQHPAQLHALIGAHNVDTLVDLLISLGLPASKIVIGLPSHGIYRQVEIKMKTSRSKAKTNEVSILERKLSRNEICELRNQINWTLTREADGTAPALIRENSEWIGFDDELSVRLKAKYAKLRGLAGVAIYSLNDDDPTNKCELEGSYALTRSIMIGLDDGSSNLDHLITQTPNSMWKIVDSPGDFSDVLERYGNIERVVEQEESGATENLPCDKPGYRVHPKDCTHFYRCVKLNSSSSSLSESSGTLLRFKYKCGTGLVFDEKLAMCNHPSWSNRCPNSGEIEQLEGQNICHSANTFYQKQNDCGYFHYCNEKLHAYQFKCPFELGFDEEKLSCNWKWLVRGCNVPAPNITSQNNIKDLFNSNLIKSQPDQLNSYLNIDSPDNSLNLNHMKEFDSKRTNLDSESIELDKMASEIHLTRQRRSTSQEKSNSNQESSSIAKSIKNKMNGLIGSVKSLLGSENKEKVDANNKDIKSDSSRRQDNSFSDWLNFPFLYNSPSQVVQTFHLPVNSYSLSTSNLNKRPVLTNRIPLPKNLQPMLTAPMLTSANVQSYSKLNPPPIIFKEFNMNQANSNPNNNLQSMVNAHSMHHSMQLRQPFIENDKISSILISHSSSSPKINSKQPMNNLILNGNNGLMKTEYKMANAKSKNLKNNYKEKKIQRRPDIQLSELVKQELNKFRLNNKPQYPTNMINNGMNKQNNNDQSQSPFNLDSHHHSNQDESKEKTKNNNLHSSNVNHHFQSSNTPIKPNVVHYHFEPLAASGDMHHLDDNQQLHYHHHQHHSMHQPPVSSSSNAVINHHPLKDEHVHIPFASNQQVNPITVKPTSNKNNNNYDPLLSSDLFKDYSIDIRPIHLKSHSKLNNQLNSNQLAKQTTNKQNKNGFVPMKSQSNKKHNQAKLLQASSSSKNDYHDDNRKQQSTQSKNNKIIDEFVFIENRRNKQQQSNIVSIPQKNTNLLIIPVPDHHPKAQSLEEIQRLVTYYPEFFPENFNLNSKISQVNGSLEQLLIQKNPNTDYFVVTVDDKNQNSIKPIIKLEEYLRYDTPEISMKRQKNKKSSSTSSKPSQVRKSNKNKSQLKQQSSTNQHQSKPFIPEIPPTPVINTATSKAPVVIKLEIPHGKAEIVERIFDKVKDDLIHTTSSLGPDRPVYISVTTPVQNVPFNHQNNKQTTSSISTTTESVLNSSIKDSSLESDELIDTSKVYLLGEQQIPQHVFESLKQVIHDHVTEHIIEKTTTEMPSSKETESEIYATRKSSLRTTSKPSRKRTTTTTTTPKSIEIHKNDDYKEDSARPVWNNIQNWPPNLSYLSLLRNRQQNNNKTNFYDDPLIKSHSIPSSSSSINKSNSNNSTAHSTLDKQHAISFTITSYLAETSTSSPNYQQSTTTTTTQSPYKRASNRFKSDRNQKNKQQTKQNVDLYLINNSNGQTEIHKTTNKGNDVHLAASLQSVKHVDQFESIKEKHHSDHLDTTGFIDDNFLKHINQNDNLLPNKTSSSLLSVQNKQIKSETLTESYQMLPNVIKQYQKLRNSLNPADLMPETTCLKEGLFSHPLDCNKYYECIYDQVLNKFVSHAFECKIKVAFDNRIIGCSSPSDPTVCISSV